MYHIMTSSVMGDSLSDKTYVCPLSGIEVPGIKLNPKNGYN